MIGSLEGRLTHKAPDYIIIDVHGVGYIVHVPLTTFCDLPELGQNVHLNIHTHIREDALQLYGFRTVSEKEMFLHLTTVNGVGPRLAVNILSGIHPDEIRMIILQQEVTRLRSVPGVGKKIAERIILELRDRLKGQKDREADPIAPGPDPGAYSDAFSALINLGYKAAEADRSLKQARKSAGEDASLERLLKEALRLLA